jgi:hypothetical protein
MPRKWTGRPEVRDTESAELVTIKSGVFRNKGTASFEQVGLAFCRGGRRVRSGFIGVWWRW